MHNGWIKLHRKLLEKGYYKKSQYIHLWIHLLLKANHQKQEFMFNNEIIIIKEGQLLTGRKQLAKETGISQTTIERILKMLESEHQIGQQKTTKFRVITITNWHTHQIVDIKTDNKRTTSGQQADTNKNDKKIKNDKNKILSPNGDFISQLITIFTDEYSVIKKIPYKIILGKDRSAMGKLLAYYKKQKPDQPAETVKSDLRVFFNHILRHDFNNAFLNQVTISKLNSNFNEYYQAIRQPANRGFDPSANDSWAKTD